MASIVERGGIKRTDTYCKHMKNQLMLHGICDFCPTCGEPTHKDEPVVREVCSECEKPVIRLKKQDAVYCAFCREKFDE